MGLARKVFVSYAHEDRRFAERVARELESGGHTIWMDPRIEAGQRWDRVVEDQIARCQRVVVILSPDAVASENVLDEVSYALDHGKEILPVLYRDCNVPLRLNRIQYFDARGDYRVGDLLAAKPGISNQKRKHAWRPVVGAAVAAVAITFGVALYFNAVQLSLGGEDLIVIAAAALGIAWGVETAWSRWRRRPS
jgi:hypothetical protein